MIIPVGEILPQLGAEIYAIPWGYIKVMSSIIKFSLHYDFGDDGMFTIRIQNILETSEKIPPNVIKEKDSI